MVSMNTKVITLKPTVLTIRMDSLYSKVKLGSTLVGVDELIRFTAKWADI